MRSSDWSSDVCSSGLFEAQLNASFAVGAWPVNGIDGFIQVEIVHKGVAGFSVGRWRWKNRCIRIRAIFGLMRSGLHNGRSEEHTSELQSLMRISYAVFCLKKKNTHTKQNNTTYKEADI